MFARGSRYRPVTESTSLDASGQRLRGKTLRVIPRPTGRFLHAVQDRDRLDLLGFKFYGDATRWWQICDANPPLAFPNDLLDRRPLIDEILVVVNPAAAAALAALGQALAALGAVRSVTGGAADPTLTIAYTPTAQRGPILTAIAAGDFHLVRASAWTEPGTTVEAFALERVAVKLAWRRLFDGLLELPGVVDLEPDWSAGMFRVTYNTQLTTRGDLRGVIEQHGFALDPLSSYVIERVGDRVVVPPNEIA